jgi:hypothetical protein
LVGISFSAFQFFIIYINFVSIHFLNDILESDTLILSPINLIRKRNKYLSENFSPSLKNFFDLAVSSSKSPQKAPTFIYLMMPVFIFWAWLVILLKLNPLLFVFCMVILVVISFIMSRYLKNKAITK